MKPRRVTEGCLGNSFASHCGKFDSAVTNKNGEDAAHDASIIGPQEVQLFSQSFERRAGHVAAFILKNRGFKARCLRGGISSWTGPLVTNSDGVHMPRRAEHG